MPRSILNTMKPQINPVPLSFRKHYRVYIMSYMGFLHPQIDFNPDARPAPGSSPCDIPLGSHTTVHHDTHTARTRPPTSLHQGIKSHLRSPQSKVVSGLESGSGLTICNPFLLPKGQAAADAQRDIQRGYSDHRDLSPGGADPTLTDQQNVNGCHFSTVGQ